MEPIKKKNTELGEEFRCLAKETNSMRKKKIIIIFIIIIIIITVIMIIKWIHIIFQNYY